MALANYSDLLTAVANWLDDSSLTDRIPEFIALAEAEFNRRLRTDDMAARVTATLDGQYLALPSDFKAMRSIHVEATPDTALEQMALGELYRAYSGYTTGTPRAYAIADGQIVFAPIPASGTVELIYWAKIPALTSTNTTNWLMTAHPDLYLFGTLAQAEFYGWTDQRLALVKGRTDEIIEQINTDSAKRLAAASPIAPRAVVSQVRGSRI